MSAQLKMLKALIPYSRENIQLAFKPNQFFNELERLDSVKRTSARSAFDRAVKKGLVKLSSDGVPVLTKKGERKLAPFVAKKLKHGKLMVVFDIPEAKRQKRDHLRLCLREFKFKQIQRSVWATDVDCRKYIEMTIDENRLSQFVRIFEVHELTQS